MTSEEKLYKSRERQRRYRIREREKYLASAKKYRDSHKEQVKELGRLWRVKNKTKLAWQKIKSKYGLSENEYNILFEKSGFKCNICGKHQSVLNRPLFVDHDHKTGKVRGLLCRQCNSIIGYSYENCDILFSAINYLQAHIKF